MPGSRAREISFNLIDIMRSAELFFKNFPKCRFILPTTAKLEPLIMEHIKNYDLPLKVVIGREAFENSLLTMSAAICVSGTATLQLSLSGVPAVTCYKTNALNFLLMKLFFKQKDPILPNILLQKEVYPCYLQSAQTPANLSTALIDIYNNISFNQEQMSYNANVLKQLLIGKEKTFEDSVAYQLKKNNLL